MTIRSAIANSDKTLSSLRSSFPIFAHHPELVYLDNAATTHKPQVVIDRLQDYMSRENATVRRGIYQLSQISTELYEKAREAGRRFLNAAYHEEIIFTRGCTESLNLLASSLAELEIEQGDEIIISQAEHHANIVPWQVLCQKKGAKLKIAPINQSGEIIISEYQKLLSPQTKIISIAHIYNSLGTINPIKQLIALARQHSPAVFIVDGAQGAPHMSIDVQDLDCDFYTFSGHKVYGPTGIGILYGRKELLKRMPPYQTGGDMIEEVSFSKTTFAESPQKFEAGTPPIAEAIALEAALDFITDIGLQQIADYERELLADATEQLSEIRGLHIIGEAKEKASLISFTIDSVHPYDLATLLDENYNIAIRSGHHCAQPVMRFYDLPGTARVSLAPYNTRQEIEILSKAITESLDILL